MADDGLAKTAVPAMGLVIVLLVYSAVQQIFMARQVWDLNVEIQKRFDGMGYQPPNGTEPPGGCGDLDPIRPGHEFEGIDSWETPGWGLKVHANDNYFYIELPLSVAETGTDFSVAAVQVNGPRATQQEEFAFGWEESFHWRFKLSPQRTSEGLLPNEPAVAHLQVLLVDLSLQSLDEKYDNLMSQTMNTARSAELPKVAVRRDCDGEVTHVVFDARRLLATGFNEVPSLLSNSQHPILDRETVNTFDFGLQFTAFYPRADQTVRFCLFELPVGDDGDDIFDEYGVMTGRLANPRVGGQSVRGALIGDYTKGELGANFGIRESLLLNPSYNLLMRLKFPTRRQRTLEDGRKERYTIWIFIDPSVPKFLWNVTKDGIEAWNKAFIELHPGNSGHLGYRYPDENDLPRIMACKPDDASCWPENYDQADLYTHTVSWSPYHGHHGHWHWGHQNTDHIFDPRSGEILKINMNFGVESFRHHFGDLLLSGAMQHSEEMRAHPEFQSHAEYMASGAGMRRLEQVDAAGMPTASAKMDLYMAAHNPTPQEAFELMMEGFKHDVVHQTGHALGMAKNFRGSRGISFEDLQKKSYVMENGQGDSVMDILAPNLISKATKDALKAQWGDHAQDDPYDAVVFMTQPGAYDVAWVIYAYAPNDEEAIGCNTYPGGRRMPWCYINPNFQDRLEEPFMTKFSYGGEENHNKGDPYTVGGDMTDDPIRFANETFLLALEAYPAIKERSLRAESSWVELDMLVQRTIWHMHHAYYRMIRFIGGISTRNKIGPNQGTNAPTATYGTPQEEQESALQTVLHALVSPDLRPPTELVQDLTTNHGPGTEYYSVKPSWILQEYEIFRDYVLAELVNVQKIRSIQHSSLLLGIRDMTPHVLRQISSQLLGIARPFHMPDCKAAFQNDNLMTLQRTYGELMTIVSWRSNYYDDSGEEITAAVRSECGRVWTALGETYQSMGADPEVTAEELMRVELVYEAFFGCTGMQR